LSNKHQDNRHIKEKIRQQLQILRDKGYLEFLERGRYRLT
jgi:type II restriction enzyme